MKIKLFIFVRNQSFILVKLSNTIFSFLLCALLATPVVLAQRSTPSIQLIDSSKRQELINYNKWVYNYAAQKQFDSARKYSKRAVILSRQLKNEDLIAHTNIAKAYLFYFQVEVDSAKYLLSKMASRTDLHDSILVENARVLNAIAMYEKDYKSGIPHILRMEELLRKNGIHTFRDSIKLSTTYLSMAGLHKSLENFTTSHSYYDKALRLNPDAAIESFIYFYKAELYSEEKDLRKAIEITQSAISMEEQGKNRSIFLPTYYLALSKYYLQLEKGDSAVVYGMRGLKNNEECQLDLINGAIGDGYSLQKKYLKANRFYEAALEESISPISEELFHKKLRDSYIKLGDYEKALSHNDAYLKLKDSLDGLKVKQEVLAITKKFESTQKELEIERLHSKDIENTSVIKFQQSRLRLISFGLVSSLLILGLLLYFYLRQKTQKQLLFRRNLDLAKKLKENDVTATKPKLKSEHNEINDKQRLAILTKLDALVAEQFYLDTEMSLSKLAKRMGTNTSYLSKIINEDYEKTFANFINELRLTYTLKRMESQPEFRKLTIEHIAEKSGFASSSTFYTAFKKFTGLTPSYYIKQRVLH